MYTLYKKTLRMRIMAVGSHSDYIELGYGGFIAREEKIKRYCCLLYKRFEGSKA